MVDILIVGLGGAGLTAGLSVHEHGKSVMLVGKSLATSSQTVMAQGGINSALGNVTPDTVQNHIADTIKSAHGLCSVEMVQKMCENAPQTMAWLDDLGVPFDRVEGGKIAQRQLGGASSKRACYAQDYTGLKILHTLYDNSLKRGIEIREGYFLLNLIVEDGITRGATFLNITSGEVEEILAKAVILATGGYGTLYKNYTTNATNSTGDGIASILRAGGKVSDMEFIQFHPTALKHSSILISESARGEGGYLVNSQGERFVDELLPRDIVSREIYYQIQNGQDVFLDLRHLGEKKLMELMPQEVHLCKIHEGIDPSKELIPIKPVAHYTMGGIDVNENFEVDGIQRCYAVGECSNAKVHGANRLGGNSLLEIIAFGRVVGELVSKNLISDEVQNNSKQFQKDKGYIEELFKSETPTTNFYQVANNLGEKFYKYAGIVRKREELNTLLNKIERIKKSKNSMGIGDKAREHNSNLIEFLQFLNLLDIAQVVAKSALLRDESRGAHYREEYPNEERRYLGHFKFWIEGGELKSDFFGLENR